MPTSTRRIEEIIDQKVGDVRVEGFDLSFGEIISLLSNKDLSSHEPFYPAGKPQQPHRCQRH